MNLKSLSFLLFISAGSLVRWPYHSTSQWDKCLQSANPVVRNAIQKLENQMKYGFALRFLIGRQSVPGLELLQANDTVRIRTEANFLARDLLERFRIGDYCYDLWKIRSMNAKREYILLADSTITGTGVLYLFLRKHAKWHFCDSLELSSTSEGLYEITQLNGHGVLKVKRAVDMTGLYEEEEGYVGISKDRFVDIFRFIRLEIYQAEGAKDSKWRVGEISLVDLNHDGFMDIVEKEKTEIMDMTTAAWDTFASSRLWLRTEHSSYFFNMSAKKIITQRRFSYFWNPKNSTFYERP